MTITTPSFRTGLIPSHSRRRRCRPAPTDPWIILKRSYSFPSKHLFIYSILFIMMMLEKKQRMDKCDLSEVRAELYTSDHQRRGETQSIQHSRVSQILAREDRSENGV